MAQDTNAVLQHWQRQQALRFTGMGGMDDMGDVDGDDDSMAPTELPEMTLGAVEKLNVAISTEQPVCDDQDTHDLAFFNLVTACELSAPDDVLVACGRTWWEAQQRRDADAGADEPGVRP